MPDENRPETTKPRGMIFYVRQFFRGLLWLMCAFARLVGDCWLTLFWRPLLRLRATLRHPPSHPDDVTPFAVLLSADPMLNYLAIDVTRYAGLLYVQVIKDSKLRLLTVWKSQEAYGLLQPPFLETTSLKQMGVVEEWKGVLGNSLHPKKPLLARLSLAGVLVTLSSTFALVGWSDQLGDLYDWLTKGPEVHVADAPETYNVLLGDPVRFPFHPRTERQLGICRATFENPTAQPRDRVQLEPIPEHTFKSLAPSSSAEVKITGLATTVGECDVLLQGRTTYGLFGRSANILLRRHVKVWAPHALGRPSIVEARARLCTVGCQLDVGVKFPAGLEMKAVLENKSHIEFVGVLFPGVLDFQCRSNDDPGKEVTTVRWHTPPLPEFRPVTFFLLLESKGDLRREDWEPVVQKLYIRIGQ